MNTPEPNSKPATQFSKRKIAWIVIGIFLLLMLAVNLPGLVQAIKHKIAADKAFADYGAALASDDFKSAYEHTSPEFQQKTDFQSFVAQHQELQSAYGKLKSVTNSGGIVEGRGSPMRWVAQFEGDLQYEKETIRVVYELHYAEGKWLVFGYKKISPTNRL